MKSQPKHPWCKKVAAKNLKRPCWKRYEIKMDGQGLLLLMELKFLIMMTRPQNITVHTTITSGNSNFLQPGHNWDIIYSRVEYNFTEHPLASSLLINLFTGNDKKGI